jgi:hypothetical protein
MAVVFVANQKLLLNTNLYHIVGVMLIILSVASYFAVLFIENTIDFDAVVGIFKPLMSHPMTWLGLLFVVWINYALDKIFDYIGYLYDSKQQENITEITDFVPLKAGEERTSRTSSRSSTRRNLEEQGHTGFAYAEENNPNPALFEITRKNTNNRLSQMVKEGKLSPPPLIQMPSLEEHE